MLRTGGRLMESRMVMTVGPTARVTFDQAVELTESCRSQAHSGRGRSASCCHASTTLGQSKPSHGFPGFNGPAAPRWHAEWPQPPVVTGGNRRRLASRNRFDGDCAMLSVREFMGAVARELARRGTSARDLLALQFEAGSFDLRVIVRPVPHPADYPDLEQIFDMVSETCEQDGIALSDLGRITFFATEVNLECSGLEGAVYSYPLRPVTVH
jgi:hypothetical protein